VLLQEVVLELVGGPAHPGFVEARDLTSLGSR